MLNMQNKLLEISVWEDTNLKGICGVGVLDLTLSPTKDNVSSGIFICEVEGK